jgi:hypothetical protein
MTGPPSRLLEYLEPLRDLNLWPSAVDFSGRAGLHCFWRLDRCLPVDEIERYNKALATLMQGDVACHNRTRLLRIPGTINEKKAGGLVETLDFTGEIHPIQRLDTPDLALPPESPASQPKAKKRRSSKLAPLDQYGRDWGQISVSPFVLLNVEVNYLFKKPSRGWKNARYPSRSECEQSILYKLIGAGASDQQLHSLADEYFAKHREYAARHPDDPDGYLRRSIDAARSEYAARTGKVTSPDGGWPKVAEPKHIHIGDQGRDLIVSLANGQPTVELVREIQERSGIKRRTAYQHIKSLVSAGSLRQDSHHTYSTSGQTSSDKAERAADAADKILTSPTDSGTRGQGDSRVASPVPQ